MWIRSQDKKRLADLNGLIIINCDKNIFEILGVSTSNSNKDSWWSLGKYTSKEKAMKVLDMIQGCITGNKLTNNHYEIFRDCPASGLEFHGVFQMPQDEEVE